MVKRKRFFKEGYIMKIPKRILRKFSKWRKAQEKAVKLQLDIDAWCLQNKIKFNKSIPHGIGWSITPKDAMLQQIKEIEDVLSKE